MASVSLTDGLWREIERNLRKCYAKRFADIEMRAQALTPTIVDGLYTAEEKAWLAAPCAGDFLDRADVLRIRVQRSDPDQRYNDFKLNLLPEMFLKRDWSYRV